MNAAVMKKGFYSRVMWFMSTHKARFEVKDVSWSKSWSRVKHESCSKSQRGIKAISISTPIRPVSRFETRRGKVDRSCYWSRISVALPKDELGSAAGSETWSEAWAWILFLFLALCWVVVWKSH